MATLVVSGLVLLAVAIALSFGAANAMTGNLGACTAAIHGDGDFNASDHAPG